SRLEKLPGVSKVHHLHVWCINEHDVSLECHIKAADLNLLPQIQQILRQDFNIRHSNIQIENLDDCPDCEL
ncbi:MAG: cation transporter, partial [Alphaproteobacteria bacterium]|nr:cation transporter [Alphaproteobacteria bacterium]